MNIGSDIWSSALRGSGAGGGGGGGPTDFPTQAATFLYHIVPGTSLFYETALYGGATTEVGDPSASNEGWRGGDVHVSSNKAYGAAVNSDAIKRFNLDATSLEIVVSNVTLGMITLDNLNDIGYGVTEGGRVFSFTLNNGTTSTIAEAGHTTNVDLQQNGPAGNLYVMSNTAQKIIEVTLAGATTDVTPAVSLSNFRNVSLAVDSVSEKMWILDDGNTKIVKCDLDGSNPTTRWSGPTADWQIQGAKVDPIARKLIFMDSDTGGGRGVYTFNIDSSTAAPVQLNSQVALVNLGLYHPS